VELGAPVTVLKSREIFVLLRDPGFISDEQQVAEAVF
jgi:hypothetical protein